MTVFIGGINSMKILQSALQPNQIQRKSSILRFCLPSPMATSRGWFALSLFLLLALYTANTKLAFAESGQPQRTAVGKALHSAQSSSVQSSSVNAESCTAVGLARALFATASISSDTSDTNPANNSASSCLMLNGAASLGSRVWEDSNGNGVQDSGEPGLAAATVQLLDGNNAVITTTTTNASGNFQFTQLFQGNYRLSFVAPAGYQFTMPDQGGNDTLDSDVDFVSGRSPLIVLGTSSVETKWAAGLYRLLSIGDHIWDDWNNNGIRDIGEPGIADVTVQLFDSKNGFVAATTTDASGTYFFGDLPPGDYYLMVLPPDIP